jgi:pilus assembly protein CpaB
MGARPNSRRNAAIFLILAIAFALAATIILFVFFRSLESRVAQQTAVRQQDLVGIVVATKNIEQGTTLSAEHLEVRKVPRAFFLDTMVNAPEAVVGRVPRERVLVGEAIRTERLADPKAGAGLNALIPKGQRALQVELRGAAGVGGFVTPGDYVDILFTGDAKGMRNADMEKLTPGKHTTTLLQSKLVLAVDDLLAVDDDGGDGAKAAPSVTLALTPEEALQVAHAKQTGKVTLTLRNHVDVTRQEMQGVSPDTFIGSSTTRRKVTEVVKTRTRPDSSSTLKPPPVVTPDPDQTVIVEGGSVRTITEPTPESPESP